MEKNKTIQEELEQISPEMAGLLADNNRLPEPENGYFEHFPLKMLENVKQAPIAYLPKRNFKSWYFVGSSVAAAIIISFLFFRQFNTSTEVKSMDLQQELAKVSNEELEAFVNQGERIYNYDVAVQTQLQELEINELDSFTIY